MRDLVNPVWNLFDAAVRHYNLRITCSRCDHAEVYHAAALWKMFESRDWNDDLRVLAGRFYCPRCRQTRGVKVRPKVELVDEPETMRKPLPDDADWKRAISRRR